MALPVPLSKQSNETVWIAPSAMVWKCQTSTGSRKKDEWPFPTRSALAETVPKSVEFVNRVSSLLGSTSVTGAETGDRPQVGLKVERIRLKVPASPLW